MNINLETHIDLNEILAITISKTLEYNNISMPEEEVNKMIKKLLKDEKFLEAAKNMIKVK